MKSLLCCLGERMASLVYIFNILKCWVRSKARARSVSAKHIGVLTLIWVAMVDPAIARSFGWHGTPDIVERNGQPAICLPKDARESFPIQRILMSQSYGVKPPIWVLSLAPGASPVILIPGSCLTYGESIPGYIEEVDTHKFTVRPTTTYLFEIIRVNDKNHINHFYSAAFCVGRSNGGVVEYVQYRRDPARRELIPYCDGKLNGNTSK